MQKRWAEALADVERALGMLPKEYYNKETMSDLLFVKGYVLFSSGNYAESVEPLSRSINEDRKTTSRVTIAAKLTCRSVNRATPGTTSQTCPPKTTLTVVNSWSL